MAARMSMRPAKSLGIFSRRFGTRRKIVKCLSTGGYKRCECEYIAYNEGRCWGVFSGDSIHIIDNASNRNDQESQTLEREQVENILIDGDENDASRRAVSPTRRAYKHV